MAFTIQIRRDTAANWTGTNPTLLQGEQGLETDTGKVKIGDGSTAWNSLAYNSDGVDWTGANTNFSTTGSIDATSALFDGSSDQVQVTVQGHSTQTNEIFVVETSAGTDLFSVNNSGNVTVAGTVDGRDLATDGSKLDGIEAGATADQTGSEIKTLYEAEADTNAYTDAEKSKLAGIEAGADVTDSTNVYAVLSGIAGVELGSSLTGDRSCYVDLHASDVQTDYSTRIVRQAGENGNLEITNIGTGFINFKPSGLSRLIVLPTYTISYRPLLIDGTSNEVQLTVQGNAVQTADIFVIETSTGTGLLTVDNSGNTAITGTITAAGLPSGATAVAAGAATNELWVTSGHATLPDGVVMRA